MKSTRKEIMMITIIVIQTREKCPISQKTHSDGKKYKHTITIIIDKIVVIGGGVGPVIIKMKLTLNVWGLSPIWIFPKV